MRHAWLAALALAAALAGCDSNVRPTVVTYSASGEGVQTVTSITYINQNGIRVQEAIPRLPFTVFVTVSDAQEAEIEVSAVVEPGGSLTAGVVAGDGQTVDQDFQTTEQTGSTASTISVSARLSLP